MKKKNDELKHADLDDLDDLDDDHEEDIEAAFNKVKSERESLMVLSAKREISRDPLRYVPAVSEKEVNYDGQPLAHDRVLLGSAIGIRMLNASREKRRDPGLAKVAHAWAHEARANLGAVEVGIRDLSNETAIWVEEGAWNAAKDALWRLRGLLNLMTNIRAAQSFAEWDEDEQEEWSTVLRLGMNYDSIFEEIIVSGVSRMVKSRMN